jgi:hypothetical protein
MLNPGSTQPPMHLNFVTDLYKSLLILGRSLRELLQCKTLDMWVGALA